MTVEPSNTGTIRWLVFTMLALTGCALSGLIFAAWVDNGPQILLSLGASAMAWCF